MNKSYGASTRDRNRGRRERWGDVEGTVEALTSAYNDFVAAAAVLLEAKGQSAGQKMSATDAALEAFKDRWELFRVACDRAEEFVESMKQRIGSECLVDEATGTPFPSSDLHSIPPISAARLEQMSKAVRWLVIELQHGSGGGASGPPTSHSPAPFDARFPEDPAQ